MSNKIYAAERELSLLCLSEEDKENYIKLRRQVTASPIFYDNPELAAIMWESAIEGDERNYSIYKEGAYCGNVVLQHSSEDIPEIGVDLLEEYRNQGIASKAIKLLAKTDYKERQGEYYLLRVSSRNLHSKHMVEKMGAVFIGYEESGFVTFMRKLREIAGDCDWSTVSDKMKKYFDADDEQDEEIVYRYKLTPDVFLYAV